MEITTSWRKVLEFVQTAQIYKSQHPEKTKLTYAIDKVLAKLPKLQTKFTDKLEKIDVDHCAVDDKGIVLMDGDNYKFDKDSLRIRNKERADEFDKADIKLDVHFATALPSNLTDFQIDAFSGIVISPEDAEVAKLANEEAYLAAIEKNETVTPKKTPEKSESE